QTCALPTELPRQGPTSLAAPATRNSLNRGAALRTIDAMARVIHVRIRRLIAADRDALMRRFADLAASREWRDQTPWLADARSNALFEQLYFADAASADAAEHPQLDALSAATFVRVAGDETDALALVFMPRDLSE